VSGQGRELGQADPWLTRRVMRLYAAGETIPLISRSMGWSEGRVRKVLREAGMVLTEEGAALARRSSEEARRRLLGAGWEARMRGGLVVWRLCVVAHRLPRTDACDGGIRAYGW
jgi:hypothetical protein